MQDAPGDDAQGHLALVANPASGGGTDPGEIASELERTGVPVQIYGLDALEAAVASCPRRLVAASGDGPLGPVAAVAARAGLALGIVPIGTGNDFARAMGVPLDLSDACRIAALGTRTRRVELGWMDGRPFLNAASAGLAVGAAEHATALKPRLGPAAYAAGAVVAGLLDSPLRCRVTCDGRELFAGTAWQVSIAASGAFGGGSRIDAADPQDGRLDVAVLRAGARLRLVQHAWGLRGGRLTEQRGVYHARASVAEVEVPPGAHFNVDGELVEAGPSSFSVQPQAVSVVVG
jgi:diacylglycerol kinase (ATP)